jgi:hypothetical protein
LQNASYIYDGDGNMVKGTVNGTVTYYPSCQYLDVFPSGGGETVQKYYAVGSQMVAVSNTSGGQTTLNWILSDQVGSTTVTANADGTWNSEIRYSNGATQTNYRYTGQLADSYIKLSWFNSHWYDSSQNENVWKEPLVSLLQANT